MSHHVVGLSVDTGGALLMMVLAVLVWRARPMARANIWFAALTSTLGAAVLFLNVSWAFRYLGVGAIGFNAVLLGTAGLLLITAALIVLRFAHVFPHAAPKADAPRWPWILPVVLALVHLAVQVVVLIMDYPNAQQRGSPFAGVVVFMNTIGLVVYSAAVVYLMARLAAHHRLAPAPARAVRWQTAAVALAIGAFPLYAIAAPLASDARAGLPLWENMLPIFPPLVLAGTWVWAAGRGDGRLAVFTAWSIILLIVGAVVISARYGLLFALNSGILGGLRVVGTALLAYAVVRHQLFDLDLKIKWTVNRGTIASVFVASFFVVSELASAVLSEQMGVFIGVMVTGLLVFALTPLQRLGERVAEMAMPGVQDTPAYRLVRKREVYRHALESALMDGRVTERERDVLATIASDLGLTPREVLDIERSVAPRPTAVHSS